jgi:hypothetical protein
MSVTITLDDDLADQLVRKAQDRNVSLEEWAIHILRNWPDDGGNRGSWPELNARRSELIQKRRSGGLTESEGTELEQLQATADRWLEPIDLKRLEALKPYEEVAERLAQQLDD